MAVAVAPCQYKVGRVLGEGAYAKVKEAIKIDSGEIFAVKIFNKQLMRGREGMILNEITVLKAVSQGHPNLVSLVDYFESVNNLYVVTELCRGGELFYRLCNKGHYFEKDAAQLVKTICQAVAYLHDKGIVHRDLKPENLLFRTEADNSELLIGDFGLAKMLDEDRYPLLLTTCGTPGYMAPEILQKKPYTKSVDMWAIGCIAFFLLSGQAPFDRNTSAEEIRAIVSADYTFEPAEYWQGISNSAKDFIRELLQLSPTKRLTAHQALEHPWLKTVGTCAGFVPTTSQTDLLPNIKRRTGRKLKKAVDAIRALHSLAGDAKKTKMANLEAIDVNIPTPVEEQLG